MQAASREAFAALRPQVESVLSRFSTTSGLNDLAAELYAVAALFEAQPRLRRSVADPAAPAEARSGLVSRLVEGKVSASALSVVRTAVAQRWSSPWDLLDAIESSADEVLLASAERDGALDEVEDELFRLERILDAQSQLTTLLDEQTATVQRRQDLLRGIVGAKVNGVTLALLEHAVASRRKRTIVLAIDDLIEAAAARRERSVARVVSAVALSDRQQNALAAKLSDLYGRAIDVRWAVDPTIRGGLIVRIGDEVIDGSVATRLTQARSSLTG